jgi:hypothetical protein
MIAAFAPIELAWTNASQLLLFGWGAGRTALGTAGLLLCVRWSPVQWAALVLALAWCAIAVLLQWALR